jgi:hypothetical protein
MSIIISAALVGGLAAVIDSFWREGKGTASDVSKEEEISEHALLVPIAR